MHKRTTILRRAIEEQYLPGATLASKYGGAREPVGA